MRIPPFRSWQWMKRKIGPAAENRVRDDGAGHRGGGGLLRLARDRQGYGLTLAYRPETTEPHSNQAETNAHLPAAPRPVSRSAIKSASASRPIESRNRPSVMPAAWRASAPIPACVIVAG